MMMVLLDEPTLMLFESPDKPPEWLEAVDVLNNEYRFCDDNGQRFVGASTDPDGRFRGSEYALRALGSPDIANALELVARAGMIMPNPWFADVDSLRCYLEGRLECSTNVSLPPDVGDSQTTALGNGQQSIVTVDLESLTFPEALRIDLRGRFPRARSPIFRWALSIVGLILCLACLGLIVGIATWPRFRVETMTIAFGMAGAIVPTLRLARLQRTARRLREERFCTTEFSPDGIIRRTLTRECKYHWVPGQKFLAVGDDILIFIRDEEILWLPRRAFSSWNHVDAFLETAHRHHADALKRR
jgi:hypothetical protein